MKLESYQANAVIVNQNTDPKRHGVCGNDGVITFSPDDLRDKFMAEHNALLLVAEAAENFFRSVTEEAEDEGQEDAMALALVNLRAARQNGGLS